MIKAWEKTYKERQNDIDTDKLRFGILRSSRVLDERGFHTYKYSWHCNCGNIDYGRNHINHECSSCGNTNFISEGGVFSHYVLYKSSALHVGLTNYRYTARINANKKCVFTNLTSVYDFEWNALDGYVRLSNNGVSNELVSSKEFDMNNLSRKIQDSIHRTWTTRYGNEETPLLYAIRTAELGDGVLDSDRDDMYNLWKNISNITNELNGYYSRKQFIYKYGKVKKLTNIILAPLQDDKRAILSLESATKIDNNLGKIMVSSFIYLKLPEARIKYMGVRDDEEIDHTNIFEIMKIPKQLFKLFKRNDIEFDGQVFNTCSRGIKKLNLIGRGYTEKTANILLAIRQAEILYGESLFNQIDNLMELTAVYNYDIKRLLEYVCVETKMYQGIVSNTSINTLYDYVTMSSDMNVDYERYPKSLKLKHDVVLMSYRLKGDEIMNDKINSVAEELEEIVNKSLPEDDVYSIVIPKSVQDFSNEGSRLHHCIASYAQRVANKETLILFMRDKNDIDNPLVSIELTTDFNFRQASGLGNRKLEIEERNFLKEFIDNMKKVKQEQNVELLSLCG